MTSKPNIFLVGPMGAGKTSIGRQLADALGMEFFDSDHEIEARSGATIPWIFDVEGEEGFRRREQAMIDELSQRQNIVLATGGGAVLSEANRNYLKTRGTVIYLSASIDLLLERTQRDRQVPRSAMEVAPVKARQCLRSKPGVKDLQQRHGVPDIMHQVTHKQALFVIQQV